MRNSKIITPNGVEFGKPYGLGMTEESQFNISTDRGFHMDKDNAKKVGSSGKVGVDDIPVGVSNGENPNDVWITDHKNGIDKIVAPIIDHIQNINKAQDTINKNYKKSSLSSNTAKVMKNRLHKYVEDNLYPWMQIQESIHTEEEQQKTRPNIEPSKKFGIGGWLGRNYAGLASTAASLGQLAYFVNQKPKPTDTHVNNAYAQAALRGLGGLSYSPTSRLNAASDAMRKSMYGISQAGALTPAQKYVVQTKMALDNSKLRSDIIAETQDKNIGLRSAYYNAMMQAGEHEAQRAQSARQFDTSRMDNLQSMYNKNLSTSIGSGVQSLYQMAADDNKWRQFRDTISIYRDDLDDKKKTRAAEIAQRQQEIDWQKQQIYGQNNFGQKNIYYNPKRSEFWGYVPQLGMWDFMNNRPVAYNFKS